MNWDVKPKNIRSQCWLTCRLTCRPMRSSLQYLQMFPNLMSNMFSCFHVFMHVIVFQLCSSYLFSLNKAIFDSINVRYFYFNASKTISLNSCLFETNNFWFIQILSKYLKIVIRIEWFVFLNIQKTILRWILIIIFFKVLIHFRYKVQLMKLYFKTFV